MRTQFILTLMFAESIYLLTSDYYDVLTHTWLPLMVLLTYLWIWDPWSIMLWTLYLSIIYREVSLSSYSNSECMLFIACMCNPFLWLLIKEAIISEKAIICIIHYMTKTRNGLQNGLVNGLAHTCYSIDFKFTAKGLTQVSERGYKALLSLHSSPLPALQNYCSKSILCFLIDLSDSVTSLHKIKKAIWARDYKYNNIVTITYLSTLLAHFTCQLLTGHRTCTWVHRPLQSLFKMSPVLKD